jgi:hypothetical protein
MSDAIYDLVPMVGAACDCNLIQRAWRPLHVILDLKEVGHLSTFYILYMCFFIMLCFSRPTRLYLSH